MNRNFAFTVLLLASLSVSAAAQTMGAGVPAGGSDQPMMAPPPVSAGGESVAFTSEMEKSNYLRGAINFQGAYNDNVLSSTPAEGDVSYTISPSLAFDMNRSRLQWQLNYAPGFTFYQKFTQENQVDHVFSTDLKYEMSPHVSLTLDDNLSKTPSFSGVLQPDTATTTLQPPVAAVVPPLTSTLTNNGVGQISYQFAPNSMLGVGGNSSVLYFLGDTSLPGLFDSTAYGAQAYYSRREAGRHYFGAQYAFEDIVAHPINIETQVHSFTGFYTFYFGRRVSLSLFGGAQHSETQGGGFPSLAGWSPTEGGGLNWQGTHNSFALNVSRSISTGGGLVSATHSYMGDAAFRHEFTTHLTASLRSDYTSRQVIQTAGLGDTNGHTFVFSGSLQRSLGQHLSAELGYSRINQHYQNIGAISNNPDSDRGWVTISYEFERPLGR